jgi:cytochrome c oxidase cbb3-type subunit 3
MSEEKQDQLRQGEYDGIQEYDNSLPNWWLGTFVLTLIFGFLYWFHYFVFQTGDDQISRYKNEQSKYTERYANKDGGGQTSNASITAMSKDQSALASGKTDYNNYCAACHGQLGEGGIGPNLTDSYWLHGFEPLQIKKSIVDGIPAKGMTPWKGILTDKQIDNVTAFILTLEVTNPANAKEPQDAKKSL